MKQKAVASLIKIAREIICEFQQVCKYVHQILTVVNKLKIRLLIKEDLGWYRKAYSVGKFFDSVYLIPLWEMFQRFSTEWVACFKVVMWFAFALCVLIAFMVY